MLPTRFLALALGAQLAAPVAIDGSLQYDLEPDQVLISYQVPLGRYQVSGVSTRLGWSVTTYPNGSAEIRLQVPVESFASGHPELDQQLRRALGPGATIGVEGTAQVGPSPIRFQGTLTLHGVTRPFHAALTLDRVGARVAVRTSFAIDLDSFGVQRPAEVGKTVEIEFAARLRVHPRAVTSGGIVNSRLAASLD